MCPNALLLYHLWPCGVSRDLIAQFGQLIYPGQSLARGSCDPSGHHSFSDRNSSENLQSHDKYSRYSNSIAKTKHEEIDRFPFFLRACRAMQEDLSSEDMHVVDAAIKDRSEW